MDFTALDMTRMTGGGGDRRGGNSGSSGGASASFIGSRAVKDGSRLLETYTLLEEIGHGQYGVVTKAKHRSKFGTFFAVKHIDKAKAGAKGLSSVFSEVETLTMLHHPGIVALEDVFMDEHNLWIVMEYVGGGDLYEALQKRTAQNQQLLHSGAAAPGTLSAGFPEGQVRKWLVDLLLALDYLHGKGIAHRDLKLSNVLVAENQHRVKIVDFGFAILVGTDNTLTSFCGTTAYMAPEIIGNLSYGMPVDMWALGVMLYHLLCGELPFQAPPPTSRSGGGGDGALSLEALILDGVVTFHQAAWSDVSQGAKELVLKLLTVDPARRYTAQDALKHFWIRLALSGTDGEDSSFFDDSASNSPSATGNGSGGAGGANSAGGALNGSTGATGFSGVEKGGTRWKQRAKHIFRAGGFAVIAAHRLVFLAKMLALRREGLDFALLRSFSFLVGRHYDPISRSLNARAVCPGSARVISQLCSMLEASTTIESFDISYNNVDGVDAVQQIVRVASTHASLTHIYLEGNPIPALAGRSLVRLARSNPRLKVVSVAHTGLPQEIVQQLTASLKRPGGSSAAIGLSSYATAGGLASRGTANNYANLAPPKSPPTLGGSSGGASAATGAGPPRGFSQTNVTNGRLAAPPSGHRITSPDASSHRPSAPPVATSSSTPGAPGGGTTTLAPSALSSAPPRAAAVRTPSGAQHTATGATSLLPAIRGAMLPPTRR